MCKSCSFLFFVFLIACHPDVTPLADKLQRFDRQLESAPSSILDSLNQIDASALDKGDRAYYYLLQASAKDKNYQKITTDSTLRLAESYFYHTKNYYNLGRTRYYIAKYLYSTQPEKAYILLKEAEVNMKENNHPNYRLLGLIYSQLGAIQSRQYNYSEAQHYYQKSLSTFESIEDTVSMLVISKQLAWTYITEKKYEQTKEILLKAIDLIQKINNNHDQIPQLHASLLNALNQYYQENSFLEEAVSTGRKAISLLEARKLPVPSNFYASMASSYKAICQLDSMKYYCTKMLHRAEEEKNIINQIKSYKFLIYFECQKGNFEKACKLKDEYIILKDKYNVQMKFNEIVKLEKKYNYSEKERLYYKAKNKNLWLLIFVLILSVIASFILLYSTWLHRKLKDKNKQLSDQIQKVEWGFTLTKELIKDNSKYYAQLESILNRYVQNIPGSLFEEFRTIRYIQQNNYSQHLLFALTNLNKEFAERIKQKYPNLTANEVLLASMINYQWDIEDIAQVFQTSLDAIQKRKNRLKTKINRKYPDIENLENYLENF